MKIADLNSITVRCPAAEQAPAALCCLLRIATDTGRFSFGEAHVPTPEHLDEAAELFEPLLIGADVRSQGELWERMIQTLAAEKWPLGEYIGAVSAVDLALWDLAAQAYDVALYQLLGGAHFSAVDTYLLPPEGMSDAKQILSWLHRQGEQVAGGVGLSLPSGAPDDLRIVRQVRKRIGPKRRLIVRLQDNCPDLESAFSVARQLAKTEVFWGENILPSAARQEYAKLRNTTEVPLAAGGDLYGIKQFYQLVKTQAVDIVTADLRRCGGITAGRRVADLARLEGMRVAFTAGASPLTTLAAAHLSAHCPVAMPIGLPTHFVDGFGDLFITSAQLNGGFLRLSDESGLGGRLHLDNWEALE